MSNNKADLDEIFNQAIEKYGDMVYRIAMNQMKTKEDADDIFQEVFIKWMQHHDEFNSKEHEKAWLIRVTINQCKSVYASSWHQKTTEMTDEIANSLKVEDQVEEESELLSVIRKLPEKYASVIYLFYYEELSTAEIAMTLKEKESTIRTHLTRARRKLKSMLKGVELDV